MSLAKVQEAPDKGLILLTGAPGCGKSTFCHQVAIRSMAADKPVIFVTSERSPTEVIDLLSERGMGEPSGLNFVDAYNQTVGLPGVDRTDTEDANCTDLNSFSIAITRLKERMGAKGALLVFDSLTSPYLFNGAEVVKFMRLFLSKFASEGNSVLALVDEGCGREEDLVAMMSIADGILRMETAESSRFLNVVKHPSMRPAKFEVPIEQEHTGVLQPEMTFKSPIVKKWIRAMLMGGEAGVRGELGDYVNLFWASLAHWSGMLWDPKRFPLTTYELNREDPRSMMRENLFVWPWYARTFMKLFLPRNYSQVKDMKKGSKRGVPYIRTARWERSGIVEYLDDVSKPDEHYFRIYENSDCWGLENVGAAVASHLPPLFAGFCQGFEKEEREWNAIETKCLGLGDPYCEFKIVPGEIGGLKSSLEKDSAVIERIHERLMERLLGFLLQGKPLIDRPRLGSDVQLHAVWHTMGVHPPGGERYKMALRMGGAKSGKTVSERLIAAGLGEDEIIRRLINFMEHCKVGRITTDETIRIKESCESSWAKLFTLGSAEPSCFFTTGFLNGLFSVVKNQHVKETKCIAAGDPYCEWEIISR